MERDADGGIILGKQGGRHAIETIFANVSCSDLSVSEPWYEKLFGRAADRHPMDGLAEWHFTDSAEVQLYQDKAKAGHSTLTLGVLPLAAERARLIAAGIKAGEIEQSEEQHAERASGSSGPARATNAASSSEQPAFFILRLSDPDGNLVVLASAQR